MYICNLCKGEFKNLGGLNSHTLCCEKTYQLKDEVIELYKNENSIRDISVKLNLCKTKVIQYLGNNRISASESNILAHKKYPDKFKHSEESKKLMREKHLKKIILKILHGDCQIYHTQRVYF